MAGWCQAPSSTCYDNNSNNETSRDEGSHAYSLRKRSKSASSSSPGTTDVHFLSASCKLRGRSTSIGLLQTTYSDCSIIKKCSSNWSKKLFKNSFQCSGDVENMIVKCSLVLSIFLLGVVTSILMLMWAQNSPYNRKLTYNTFPRIDSLKVHDDVDNIIGDNLLEPDNECEGDNPLAFELEAISSLHAALEMKEQGKKQKAQKLFQHAMALCPRHADVLTHYGEFFEDAERNYLMADQLYFQALTRAPHHSKALTNRKRTQPVVEELDERKLNQIDGKRQQLLQLSENNPALRRIQKEAYFQHIYHSAGIEGNTMTLSQTRAVVETRLAVGGKSVVEHNEILGLDAALKFVNNTLLHRIGAIKLEDILDIHQHVMGFVDPQEAGKFRRTQVFVGSHKPPGPDEIKEQMGLFVEWLNSDEALSLHPIQYAALAHYKFVYIHPFLDGNGRTSRLLMNWFLMQEDFPAVIIRKQDRHLYYETLNLANKGDVRPFIRFIADCTEKTIDVYLWATSEKFQIIDAEDEAKKGQTLPTKPLSDDSSSPTDTDGKSDTSGSS